MTVSDQATHEWLEARYWADDDLLVDAHARFADVGPAIEVPSETGALLATLVRSVAATRVLEVGTLFGYSAVWMARALAEGGSLDTLELLDDHADFAEQLFRDAGLHERIRVHRGPALDSLAALAGAYDLAFIDADKGGYPDYLEHALRLVRPGGLIVADNVAWGGRLLDASYDADESAIGIRRYHDLISEHPRLHSNVLPVGDGVAVSVVTR